MNRLTIGTVTAFLSPNQIIIPDDRREMIKTVTFSGGSFVASTIVIDGGTTEGGAVLSVRGVVIAAADWSTFYGYSTGRSSVSIVDTTGTARQCTIKITNIEISKDFKNVRCDFDAWGV